MIKRLNGRIPIVRTGGRQHNTVRDDRQCEPTLKDGRGRGRKKMQDNRAVDRARRSVR